MTRSPCWVYRGRPLTCPPQPELAISSVSAARALDDRDELDERRSEVVAQKPVHTAAVVAVGGVQRRQDVPVHAMVLEVLKAPDHAIERRLAALADPVGVVDLARTVDRDPDQEVVLLQKRRELVIDQRPICLQRVQDPLPRPGVLALQLDRAAEELDAHDRRLPALPRDHHLRRPPVGLEQLTDIALLQLLRHPEAAARIQHLLGEKEAVLAVEIADRARRLRHHVKRDRRARHRQQRAAGFNIGTYRHRVARSVGMALMLVIHLGRCQFRLRALT